MNTEVKKLHAILSSVLSNGKKSATREVRPEKIAYAIQTFSPMPHTLLEDSSLPVWQVRFELLNHTTPVELCLEINGEIILGVEAGNPEVINLLAYNRDIQGVSRRHIKLAPTRTSLWITDLNSTNGTRKNGRKIQPNTLYSLLQGDVLELGNLRLAVNIERAPDNPQARAVNANDIVNALAHLSAAVISGWSSGDVLDRVIETVRHLCHADEIALLLWDECTRQLHLNRECGLKEKKSSFLNILDNKAFPIHEVLRTGEPLRKSLIDGSKHEVVTGYLANSALYVPVAIGEKSVGVLVAIRQEEENEFTSEDERIICMVARFAAIAIQNSQKYEASNQKLQSKLDELSTYDTIAKALSKTRNLNEIYHVLRNLFRERWKVENIGLWLIEDATNNLVPFPKPSFHKTYAVGEELIGAVATSAAPILATDIKLFSEPMKSLEPTLQLLARSAACVPIVENNKVLGVLGAFSICENEFREDDIRLLQMISQAASAAIRNAWLFEQIDKQRATIFAAVNMLPQPMMIVDQDGKIIVSNKAADAMLNELHTSFQGNDGSNRSSLMSLTTLMNGLAESKWRTKEIVFGEKVYVATLEYSSMIGTVIVMQDVTDPVTGTTSQRHFHELAQQAFEQSKRYKKPLSCLCLGLNELEQIINDKGYTAGNQLFKGLVSVLRSLLRTPDILGRYLEHEFVVILPETGLENAKIVAERIFQSIPERSITIENQKVPLKLSIGVATVDFQTDKSVDELMQKTFNVYSLAMKDHKHPINVHGN